MTDITLNVPTPSSTEDAAKTATLKHTWQNRGPDPSSATAATVYPSVGGDPEYLNLWETHFGSFRGKILEIGAGTGFLAKNILSTNPGVQYTILDIEKHFPYIQNTLGPEHSGGRFIDTADYREVFEEDWDLLVETHCLSETPRHYYVDILSNIKTKNCFIIDYGGDPNDPNFDETLREWFKGFPVGEILSNQQLLGAAKRGCIPVYIGKEASKQK